MSDKIDINKLNQAQFARLLGISTRTVQRNPNLERLRHGVNNGCYYVWAEFWAWLSPDLTQSKGAISDKDRREKAQADLAEIERDQKSQAVLDVSEVQAEWTAFLGRLRDNLLGLADRCAPDIDPEMTLAERIDVMRRHVRASLRDVVAELGETDEADNG